MTFCVLEGSGCGGHMPGRLWESGKSLLGRMAIALVTGVKEGWLGVTSCYSGLLHWVRRTKLERTLKPHCR